MGQAGCKCGGHVQSHRSVRGSAAGLHRSIEEPADMVTFQVTPNHSSQTANGPGDSGELAGYKCPEAGMLCRYLVDGKPPQYKAAKTVLVASPDWDVWKVRACASLQPSNNREQGKPVRWTTLFKSF